MAPTDRPDEVPAISSVLANAAVRVWLQASLLIAALLIPTLFALAFDERQLNGISVWAKPVKFQVSLIVHLLTLAVLSTLIAERVRDGRLLRATAWLSSAMAIGEIAYIVIQAARGRHSHFNFETPFEATMYSLMGAGAVILVAAAAVVGWLVLRTPRDGVGSGLRWGSGLGLILGCLATLVVAGYMGGQASHWVGGVASDAGGLPVTGWSTTGGDLRVTHFFATHLMQGLPLIGWLADRTARSGPRIVFPATAVWLGVVAVTFALARAGRPLLTL